MHFRKAGVRFAVLVAFMAALLALTTTVASAVDPAEKLSVAELQTMLDDHGTVPGYLKTVVKGNDIITIDVDILAVTTGFGSGPADLSSLILFNSDDPEITKIGGIASGMSGSPIYVDDDGTERIIGALSYGDIFSTNGAGLATPIDAMINIQTAYPAAEMRTLSSPVVIDGEIKDRVMVVEEADAIASEPAKTIVATPLSAVFVGGLNPASRMYKAYTKVLEGKGVQVVTPLQGGLSSKVATYDAEFEPGSAVAVLAARGDLWAGGIGTVTYTEAGPAADTTTVVAFGHPAFWEGKSGLYLCNAWIDGIWSSTLEAYKLGRPGAVRGTLTQDRSAGVLGVDGMMPSEVSIDATATRGTDVATSSVQVPSFVADSSTGNYYGLAAASAYIAGSRIAEFDSAMNPGSAVTTTTVTVMDADTGTSYELVRRNVYSDSYDISMAVVTDVNEMVSSFQDVNANGIAHANVLSVGLETTFSEERLEAEIVDVDVVGGLKHGNNKVKISLLQYGEPATKTVEVNLNIPNNVPASGALSASAVNGSADDGESSEEVFADVNGSGSSIDRRTVKNVVDDLNDVVDNTFVNVTFQPSDMTDSGDGEEPPAMVDYDAIEVNRATDWVVSGWISKTAPQFEAFTSAEGALNYGARTAVYAELIGVEDSGFVTVTGMGSPRTYPVEEGSVYFVTPALYKKTTLVLTFQGDDSTLSAKTTLNVYVKAKIAFTASKTSFTHGTPVTLTAKVLPKYAGGKIAFQRWNGYEWATMRTVSLPASGTVSYKFTPSKGTVKVRAYLSNSKTNAATSSSLISLKVK